MNNVTRRLLKLMFGHREGGVTYRPIEFPVIPDSDVGAAVDVLVEIGVCEYSERDGVRYVRRAVEIGPAPDFSIGGSDYWILDHDYEDGLQNCVVIDKTSSPARFRTAYVPVTDIPPVSAKP